MVCKKVFIIVNTIRLVLSCAHVADKLKNKRDFVALNIREQNTFSRKLRANEIALTSTERFDYTTVSLSTKIIGLLKKAHKNIRDVWDILLSTRTQTDL